MLRTILIDDEPYILEKLKAMLGELSGIEVLAAYTDPVKALTEIPILRPDCVFLDIEMAGLNGVELALQLSLTIPGLQLIFVTAHNHFAAQAFDVNAVDYLLKPIRPERLQHAVNKLMRTAALQKYTEPHCRIQCFGTFEVTMNNRSIKWSRSRVRELLAYLLHHEGKWVSKYRLCDELWPNYSPERALSYLQICLHALRKTLKEAGCKEIVIDYSSHRYALSVHTDAWDLKQFAAHYKDFCLTESPEAAERAWSYISQGEYLDGEDWLWAGLPREEYIIKYDRLSNAILGH